MSDSGELMKKADALLGRYRRSSGDGSDGSIPVLTEVVARTGTPAGPEHTAPATSAAGLSPAQIEILMSRLQEELRPRLEAELRQRLEAHLEAAMAALTAQMTAEVEPLVRAALTEALAKLAAELRP